MEMIFGEKNYVGTVVWDSSSNTQQTKKINRTHEYVIIFAKNIKKFTGLYSTPNSEKDELQEYANSLLNLPYIERTNEYQKYLKTYVQKLKNSGDKKYKDIGKYKYLMPDTNFIFRDNSSSDPRSGCFDSLIHPVSKRTCSTPNKGYRFSQKYIQELNQITEYYELTDGKYLKILENKNATATMGIIFGKDENNVPQSARIHKKELNKVVFKTNGYDFKTKDKKVGIPKESGFNTVKPIEFLSELILNYPKKNAVIMDYFGGSGTTAISVDEANNQDGGKRTWVLVEMNENTVEDTMIPRLEYFDINDYKIFKVDECDIDEEKLLSYFSNNLENHLKANYNYNEIEEEINDLNILGIDKKQLICYKKPDNFSVPRPSKAKRFFKNLVEKYQLKSIKMYVINKDLLTVFEDLKKNLKEDGIKLEISTVPDEFKKNWENNLSILTGEKR